MLQDVNVSGAGKYSQQAFEINSLSNKYIYLSAQPSSLPLTVLTQGWQQLALIKAKKEKTAK